LRIGAIGEEDVILVFKAIGASVIPALTGDEITAGLHRFFLEGVPVVYITEAAARLVPETIQKYEQLPGMAVIPIPGIKGTDGYGAKRVRDSVIKAIGADILINHEGNEG